MVVLTDFAGRISRLISDLNRGRNLVLILDHHKAEKVDDQRVHLLDPEVFGLRGDRDITASTTCYVFACTLDPANQDLAYIATIGAVGDRFFVDGRLAGPNRDAALETQGQGKLEIQTGEYGERYILLTPDGPMDCSAFARNLDTFGGAGYHRGGPEMGIQVCLEGPNPETDGVLGELRAIQERAFAVEIERIRENAWMRTEHIQWLHVHDRFEPMGVKMIGAFLDSIRNSDIVDPERYLAGFQTDPRPDPGDRRLRFRPGQDLDARGRFDGGEDQVRGGPGSRHPAARGDHPGGRLFGRLSQPDCGHDSRGWT